LRDDAPATQFWKFGRQFLPTSLKDKENGVLDLGAGVYFLGERRFGSRLFIRPCYLDLLDLVLTGGARVLLRGTPGIGKTHFSLLLVLRLVAEGKTVVYMRGVKDSSALFYLILTPTGLLETDRHPAALPYLRDEATIFVVDAKEPKNMEQVNATTILVSSPQHGNYEEFIKGLPSQSIFFMPPWSLEEIQRCNELIYHRDAGKLKRGFEMVGGVPRHLLTNAEVEIREVLDAIVVTARLSWEDIQSNLQVNSKVSGKVFHLVPSADYRSFEYRFASSYVEDELFSRVEEKSESDLCRLVSESSRLGVMGGLRGVLFERLAHLRLVRGGTFRIRSLDGRSQDVKLTLPEVSGRKNFGDLSEIKGFSDGEYLVPTSTNLESVDSLAKPNLMFQMTVSASHPCKQAGLHKAIAALCGTDGSSSPNKKRKIAAPPARLIFVVPASMEKTFTSQPYTDAKGVPLKEVSFNDVEAIEQFVLPVSLS